MFTNEEKRILTEAALDIQAVTEIGHGDEENALALAHTVEIDLARWFGVELIHRVDRGRLFRAIAGLEARGYVRKRDPMTGRKRKCLQLTASGLSVAKAILAAEGKVDGR